MTLFVTGILLKLHEFTENNGDWKVFDLETIGDSTQFTYFSGVDHSISPFVEVSGKILKIRYASNALHLQEFY